MKHQLSPLTAPPSLWRTKSEMEDGVIGADVGILNSDLKVTRRKEEDGGRDKVGCHMSVFGRKRHELLWGLFFIIPVLQRLMTRFSIYSLFFAHAEVTLSCHFTMNCWSSEYFSGQMKVYSACSLPCLEFADICFTKWEPVEGSDFLFWRVFTSNSCDIRTSLTWAGRYKSTSRSRVCIFTKLSLEWWVPCMLYLSALTVPHTNTSTHAHYQ